MRQLCGRYQIDKKEYRDDSSGVYCFSDDACELWVFGRCFTGEDSNDGAALAALFAQYGDRMTEHLNGAYLTVFSVKKTSLCTCSMTGPLRPWRCIIRKPTAVCISVRR